MTQVDRDGWRERFETNESDLRTSEIKRLEILARRRDFLRERSHGLPGKHYDRAEGQALDWLIAIVDLLDERGELPRLVKCRGGCGRFVQAERDDLVGSVRCDECEEDGDYTERAPFIGIEEGGYDLSDPKHERHHEVYSDIADLREPD